MQWPSSAEEAVDWISIDIEHSTGPAREKHFGLRYFFSPAIASIRHLQTIPLFPLFAKYPQIDLPDSLLFPDKSYDSRPLNRQVDAMQMQPGESVRFIGGPVGSLRFSQPLFSLIRCSQRILIGTGGNGRWEFGLIKSSSERWVPD